MRGRSKWYIGGACFLLSLFFIFPVLAYWVISSFVLPPTRLKSLLITEMAKYVKGEFDCHSVELTYWETWPLAGIAIIGGSYSAPADTLFPEKPKLKVEFDKLLVRVNAMDYWQKGLITLKELSLECPDLYVRLGDNQPFDLLYEDRIPQKSPVGSLFEDLRMEIRQLALEDGHWVVENIEQKTRLDCIGMRLALSGMLISDNGRLALSCACDSSRLQTGGNLLRNDSPVSLECLFHADWQKRLVRVESAKLLIRNLPFELSGSFRQESSKRLWMDASLNLSASDLEELLTYVPEPYASKFQSYTLKGNTALATTFMMDAVYYLSFCKSATNPIDSQNIRHEQDFFVLQGFYETEGGDPEEVYCGLKRRQKKQFKRNKKEYTRLSDHIGLIPLVMVSPADTLLIAGGSEERRRFMDVVISQFDREYLDALIRYNNPWHNKNYYRM